jgi:hypothetical protein
LLTGLIAAILSLSLSCDSYGKNYASRKGCEMAQYDDNDDTPFPRGRPYDSRLPPSDPGNQRALQHGEQDEEEYERPYGANPRLPRPDPRPEKQLAPFFQGLRSPEFQQWLQKEAEKRARDRGETSLDRAQGGLAETQDDDDVPLPRPDPRRYWDPHPRNWQGLKIRQPVPSWPESLSMLPGWARAPTSIEKLRSRERLQDQRLRRPHSPETIEEEQDQIDKGYLQPRSERSQGGLVNLPGYYQKGGLGIPQMDTAAKQAHFGALNALRAARLPGPRLSAVRQGRMPGVHLIHSPVPGRVDRIPMRARTGSYILPADVVSGLGQGNTYAGAKMWGASHWPRGRALWHQQYHSRWSSPRTYAADGAGSDISGWRPGR